VVEYHPAKNRVKHLKNIFHSVSFIKKDLKKKYEALKTNNAVYFFGLFDDDLIDKIFYDITYFFLNKILTR
jgi:hypothetical protein